MKGVVNAIRLMKEPPMRLSATTLLLLSESLLLLEDDVEVVWPSDIIGFSLDFGESSLFLGVRQYYIKASVSGLFL
jgi:hypothetical protein